LPKLPPPPLLHELREIPPHLKALSAGTQLWRIYYRGGEYPVEWNEFRDYGPLGGRFDHHTRPPRQQRRKILYAATKAPICVAEVFQGTRTIDRRGRSPWLVGFELRADLELLDLTGLWPIYAGASMAIGSSDFRSRTQHWSRQAYSAYPDIGGLWYASSMYGNEPAAALYERAHSSLPASPFFHQPLTHPRLLVPLQQEAKKLNYDLL
jgi:hypothetical protein